MIVIAGQAADKSALLSSVPEQSVEREILNILLDSPQTYSYDSHEQLEFELTLRREIVAASKELSASRLAFRVFRESFCNPAYWRRTNDGGFTLQPGVSPSAAIQDIFQNSNLYGTECATAMMIVYFGALAKVYGPSRFDRLFPQIVLMNWSSIPPLLQEVGWMRKANDYLPADRRYIKNPDVNPATPYLQGENLIDLGNGRYYGHGMGIQTADTVIRILNQNRKEGATRSAYLMDSAGRPDFKKLFKNMR
ncbi:MAG: protein-glutamine gamma-glutamyltransferase [Christensenellales bacterium]|jgi:protein-glutamine gamma-glutamyltransferase